mgnify:CR=1 FL=1
MEPAAWQFPDGDDTKRDFFFDLTLHVPAGERVDVAFLSEFTVFVTQTVFVKNLEAEGKVCCFAAR